jgi:hypothetical protein
MLGYHFEVIQMKKAIMNKKITPASPKSTEDRWAAQKAQLEAATAELAAADIDFVEAGRNHATAQAWVNSAIARKTTAEKRLATFRANLGGE